MPVGIRTDQLLERDSRPAPAELAEALWATLVHLDTRLAPLEPALSRGVSASGDEPAWVDAALTHNAWSRIVDRADHSIAEIELETDGEASSVRIGWLGDVERVRVFANDPTHGVMPDPLPARPVWSERFGQTTGDAIGVSTWEVAVPEGCTTVLAVADGPATGVLLNPVLLVNAPVVRDGRQLAVNRAVPEPINLLFGDVVDRDVVEQLCLQGVDSSTAARLRQLPLSRIERENKPPVDDFEGIAVDPSDGTVTLNAPDAAGRLSRFRRGEPVDLVWYRRTDGENGNVAEGEIRLAEQGPTVRPRIVEVYNPLPAMHGSARESSTAVVDRVFGPQLTMPVTAADWERLVHQALGPRAVDWIVRGWGYSERSIVSSTVWPPPSAGQEDTSDALSDALTDAGPSTLLIALGPKQGQLSAEDLNWARRVIEGVVAEWANRVPLITDVIVTPLWPLTLRSENPDLSVPAFSLRGVTGLLADSTGREARVPKATFVLNAAIVEVHHEA